MKTRKDSFIAKIQRITKRVKSDKGRFLRQRSAWCSQPTKWERQHCLNLSIYEQAIEAAARRGETYCACATEYMIDSYLAKVLMRKICFKLKEFNPVFLSYTIQCSASDGENKVDEINSSYLGVRFNW
jgi:hypothetical protein